MERRDDACKGGNEANKRAIPFQLSARSWSAAALKTQTLLFTKKNDGHAGNGSHEGTKLAASSVAQDHDEQVS